MKPHAKAHHQAMDLMDEHVRARQEGNFTAAQKALLGALDSEARAASHAPVGEEPTRSVLYRSAASIALQAGRRDTARQLIAAGLRGNPPAEIQAELLELGLLV